MSDPYADRVEEAVDSDDTSDLYRLYNDYIDHIRQQAKSRGKR